MGFLVKDGGRTIVIFGDVLRIPDDSLLAGADVAFLDANTCHPVKYTWCIRGSRSRAW